MTSSPTYQVAKYFCPTNRRTFLSLVLSSDDEEATILLGNGVEGGPIKKVARSAITEVPRMRLPADSKLVERHSPKRENALPFPKVAAQANALPRPDTCSDDCIESLRTSPENVSVSVGLLRRMVVAPFDSIVGWHRPQVTGAFVAVALFVLVLQLSGEWLPPVMQHVVGPTEGLTTLLLVVAALLSVSASYDALEGTWERTTSPAAALFWRVVAVCPIVVVTAVDAIHRDWSPERQHSSVIGRAASAAQPYLPSLESSLLYTVAVVALLRLRF